MLTSKAKLSLLGPSESSKFAANQLCHFFLNIFQGQGFLVNKINKAKDIANVCVQSSLKKNCC